MRTKQPHIRHILNLETAISVIAGYFYSVFVSQIDKLDEESKPINWTSLTKTRYVDWSITTPIMLLVLCYVLGTHSNVPVHLPVILTVVGLDYLMLYAGYLGETEKITRWVAVITGFVAFLLMFAIIYFVFIKPKNVFANYILCGIYFVVWSLYGVFYMFEEKYKNIGMNILDLTSKCFVGLGLWVYFTKIIT